MTIRDQELRNALAIIERETQRVDAQLQRIQELQRALEDERRARRTAEKAVAEQTFSFGGWGRQVTAGQALAHLHALQDQVRIKDEALKLADEALDSDSERTPLVIAAVREKLRAAQRAGEFDS